MARGGASLQQKLKKLIYKFNIYGDFVVGTPFGNGHVNDTFLLTFDQGGVRLNYVLQHINSEVFKEPVKVMENIDRVTERILRKIYKSHTETRKRTIRLLRTSDNKPYVFDDNGNCWRAYIYIERARAYDVLETPEQAFGIAKAFGEFQQQLIDLPGDRLNDTIPDFHNTPKRIQQLEEAIAADVTGRVKNVQKEIDFILSRKDDAGELIRLNQSGDIPERITHNDTKCNNILIDDLSGEGICVIDLDTVMPGLSLYDFGDMVRACTSPAEEDETDLDKVYMRFDMYEALFSGFCESAGAFMTAAERENLANAGKIITLEIGTRFLTDYLSGDKYFKIKRAHHNLERCRAQLKLVSSIEEQMNDMMNLLLN
ncbi:MAG: aminoglycoside phosphotransferase family protein [Lentisphaeria bacterium]|nr:aminoglycoside phosphotransferase family protein [Lentisphaeria bacterium]